jgi:CubicO group peptidase (beta-lactamase class C family)
MKSDRSLLACCLSRRSAVAASLAMAAGMPFAAGKAIARNQSATPATPALADPAARSLAIAEAALAEKDLRAVILRITIDGEEIVTQAIGESMTGVPATIDMHVRNGAVAISCVSTVLLQLVDEGTVTLDDTIDQWLPDLPAANLVTLRMLANMTAGYPDFVQNPELDKMLYSNPFRDWTPDDLLALSFDTPRVFAPGTNWDYSHSDYVILGLALEAITGKSLADLLQRYIIEPLGLTGTGSEQTAWMPQPVLHAFSSERRAFLEIPLGTPFYEDSTYWNPSWTLPRGAVQYSTITDMATSMEAIGNGSLLSPEMHKEQADGHLLGFGEVLAGCPNCHTMDERYNYGLGIVRSGGWLLQNPSFAGYGGTVGYHPESRITIAVVTTFGEGSFDETGNYRFGNASQGIFRHIGESLNPNDPPLFG